jgi:type II secretory pathway pseudopilin PulG
MKGQRGALLIEQIVAFVVLAIAATSVFSLLSVGHLSAAMAQDLSVATNLAQRKLEETRAVGFDAAAPIPRQAVDPTTFPNYEWEVEVLERVPGLKEVHATVYWRARGRERTVSLVTIIRSP